MLASDVLTPARRILSDASVTRWTDADLLGWLGEGEREVMKRRPDAGLTTVGAVTLRPTAAPTAVGDTLAVGDDFKRCLVDYVCYRAFLEDAESTENASRAKAHLELFAPEAT
ncbi:MAG: hypothetical protein M0R80_31840 [Proteobacteria bacterium]|jgi:hypothetical protein|nr:hypothetical protein [Pseudomonadota bacterium]